MKAGMEKIKNAILYAGLKKDEFILVQPDLTRINRTYLNGMTAITAVYMVIMLVVSIRNSISTANRTHFIWCLCLCCGILLVSVLGFLKTKTLTLIAVYAYLSTIFSYGIAIGSTQIDQTAVSFLIFIMVGPLLFYDKPIRLSCLVWIFNIIFLMLCIKIKSPAARDTDLVNALSYGVISFFLTTGSMMIKVNRIWLQGQMKIIAETDSLTGLKNRNCFDHNYGKYVKKAVRSVSCIYIDANGLHLLNNTQGHEAGDQMLKYLAEQIVLLFGYEDVYRIGGDEYVIFCCDADEKVIGEKTEALSDRMQQSAYSISIGIFNALVKGLDMDDLIRKADASMYQKKKEYYEQKKHDRRKRRGEELS